MVKKLVVTLMIRPQPRSFMPGSAARIICTGPSGVDRHELAPDFRRQFFDGQQVLFAVGADLAGAETGIVDQNIDLPERVGHLANRDFAIARIRHIAAKREHAIGAGFLIDRLRGTRRRITIDIHQRQPVAIPDHPPCHRLPDSTSTAGDNRHPYICLLARHRCPLLPECRSWRLQEGAGIFQYTITPVGDPRTVGYMK